MDNQRIIIHFDYDCFYAQVVQNKQPSLRSLPLGIKQKSILATCNYHARHRGVKKLMLVSDAIKICPDLILVDGEDLTPFRDVSKHLYRLLRSYSWNGRAERLGLDEVFLDVSDIVAYNMALLNQHALQDSFFVLSKTDPEVGFAFDASGFAGCVHVTQPPHGHAVSETANALVRMRLLLASHLALHLRTQIEEQGYTSACGISANKALSKIVGTKNKPRNQTTLLALCQADLISFVDSHPVRSIPGIGARMASLLENHVRPESSTPSLASEKPLTAAEVRTHPGMDRESMQALLHTLGMDRDIGHRTWALLHGRDDSEVKSATNTPTQISIEDTYAAAGLTEAAQVGRELTKLAVSLIRRMRVDLADSFDGDEGLRWVASPKTLRLSTRPRHDPKQRANTSYNHGRVSRSQPIPGYLLNLTLPIEQLAARLVEEALRPMFVRLNPGRDYNIGMLNICVANMVPTGADAPGTSGRDIAGMFRRQDEVLREFTAYEDGASVPPGESVDENVGCESLLDEDEWEDAGTQLCENCGRPIPAFAAMAHRRFHQLDDGVG